MEPTVLFRDFEERDIDFIYKCKNDERLNSMIVGQYHPFSYEDAVKWVHGCMGEHDTYKFWAICTNDDEKRIVGWVSLSNIDKMNQSACFHGIVIGDKLYRDGTAWIESYLFIYHYVFETLSFNRLYGSNIEDQKASTCIGYAMFEIPEGIARQAIYKNGKYNNVIYMSILKDEYLIHKNNGDFELNKIIYRIGRERRKQINTNKKMPENRLVTSSCIDGIIEN